MHTVVDKAQLSPNVTRLVIEAPRIAEIRRPGQFVIVHRGPGAERIPLTIADADRERGTISLVIQAVGKSTEDLVRLAIGEGIQDVAGPLGRETELIESGHAVCVGGGVGTAVVHPIAMGLAERGVKVTSVIGGRSKEWVIFEDELRRAGDVVTCTDDGSYGRHGFVTEALKDLLDAGGIDAIYAVGPVPMMRAIAELTRPYGVPTFASLNAIMLDGTGMCGGCRVQVGGQDGLRLCRRPGVRRPRRRLPRARRPAGHLPRVRSPCPGGRPSPGSGEGRGRRRTPMRRRSTPRTGAA